LKSTKTRGYKEERIGKLALVNNILGIKNLISILLSIMDLLIILKE